MNEHDITATVVNATDTLSKLTLAAAAARYSSENIELRLLLAETMQDINHALSSDEPGEVLEALRAKIERAIYPKKVRAKYDPSQTIYYGIKGEDGFLTAHILTNTGPINAKNAKPSTLSYFESYEDMQRGVEADYGKGARLVGETVFLNEMSRRGMSSSWLEA
jgi:hypothetical protein